MIAIILFMAVLAVVVGWWMTRQRLTSKPWLEVGDAGALPQPQGSPEAAARIGLCIFLAVIGALFSLLISAYLTRMAMADWWSIPIPPLLWVNTAALAAASLSLQWAKVEGRRGKAEAVRAGLAAAGVLGLLFVCGQLLAWRQLVAAGYVLADNPSNSFFYMITGLHGLHILGGLLGLGRTMLRARKAAAGRSLALSIDLCATYWHFMLLVWLILFALFAGWANGFADLCRALVS